MRVVGIGGLLVLALACGGLSLAAEAPPAKTAEAEAKIAFAPEVEKKLTEFFAKLAEARRKQDQERMKKQIEEVAKVTGLGAKEVQALEKPAQEAAELSGKESLAKMEKLWRKQMNREPEQLLEMVDQMMSQVEAYAQSELTGTGDDLADQAVWTEALQRVLSPAQAAVWNQVRLERKQTLEKEFAGVVKRSVERTRDQQLQLLLAKTAEIKLNLGLTEERGQKLDALAKSATDRSAELWRARAEKMLFVMPEPQRRAIAAQGNLYIQAEEDEAADRQAVWKDGLAQLFSPEEQKRLDDARAEKKTRRTRVLGQVMLALLDEQVAFTTRQREQLQPMVERLLGGESEVFQQLNSEEYSNLSPQTFLSAGRKATAQDLEGLLDPIQRERWEAAANANFGSRRSRIVGQNAPPDAKPEQSGPAPEPEHFEEVISDFLCERAEAEWQRLSRFMTLKAEDVARVASLSPETSARLQTAARGAATESLEAWKSMIESTVRSNLGGVSARDVAQRLDGLEDYQLRRVSSVPPEKRSVWEKTVETEIGDAQRKAWQKELDERAAFRDSASIAIILAEFDRKNFLTPQQWTALEPRVAAFFKDYGPDVARMFSSSNPTPWYLQTYSMFLPFASIPEKDLKEIFGKEQWDRWASSNEFSNTSNYWENIRNLHEQRLKAAKK